MGASATAFELLEQKSLMSLPSFPCDPFRIEGSLVEAYFMDCTINTVKQSVGVLVDMSAGMCDTNLDTALLVFESVSDVHWNDDNRKYSHTPHYHTILVQELILGSPHSFVLGLHPGGDFTVNFQTASAFAGSRKIKSDGSIPVSFIEMIDWQEQVNWP
jgi:hypothetical protein